MQYTPITEPQSIENVISEMEYQMNTALAKATAAQIIKY